MTNLPAPPPTTGAGGGSPSGSDGGVDVARVKYGFYIVIGGLVTVVVLYIASNDCNIRQPYPR
jgi:hypothetical protein